MIKAKEKVAYRTSNTDEYARLYGDKNSPLDPRVVRYITHFRDCAYHRHETKEDKKSCSAGSTSWWKAGAEGGQERTREDDEGGPALTSSPPELFETGTR